MSFNRRGFLSLVATSFAAAYAAEVLPAPPAPLPSARLARMIKAGAEPAQVQIQVLSFAPELEGFQEICEPGGIVTYVARVQRVFQPQRLLFAACDLNHFEVMPFVGSDGLPDLLHPVPASAFGPLSYAPNMIWAPAQVGEEIVLSLRNVTNMESEVRGVAMVGRTLV